MCRKRTDYCSRDYCLDNVVQLIIWGRIRRSSTPISFPQFYYKDDGRGCIFVWVLWGLGPYWSTIEVVVWSRDIWCSFVLLCLLLKGPVVFIYRVGLYHDGLRQFTRRSVLTVNSTSLRPRRVPNGLRFDLRGSETRLVVVVLNHKQVLTRLSLINDSKTLSLSHWIPEWKKRSKIY